MKDGESAAPGPAAVSPDDAKGLPIYEVGTLRYTRRQLGWVLFWLVGGDFAFTFFEQIFGRFIPLFVNDLHGSNTLIAVITGSIAGLMNVFFAPNISMLSDRHRGPLGRRIPFLLWATPCTVLSLLLIGFAPEIGQWLQKRLLVPAAITPTALTLVLLSIFAVSFHLWNMILVNAYNWLMRDVVPIAVMGRFLSSCRVVSTLATFAFLWWVFPHLEAYRKVVFPAIGSIYAVVFLLMCWQVREGSYPSPVSAPEPSIVRSFVRYFRECLSVPIYRDFFLLYGLMVAVTSSAGPFVVLFARDRLGLAMGDIGRIAAWGTLASALVYPIAGWISDRFNPFLIVFAGIAGIALATLIAFLFVHSQKAWLVYSLLSVVPGCAWGLGFAALTMDLFPPEKFGQFSAGLNVFGYGGIVIGNSLIGVLMDRVHSHYEVSFLWSASISAAALFPMWLVYRGWKQNGGPHHYVPPLPAGLSRGQNVATHPTVVAE